MKHMKYKNRILSFLTVICCLAGSILPAYIASAGDASDSQASSAPRVVFKNKPKPAPDLYVTKQLDNPESYTYEQPQFSFTLYLNGDPAPSSRTYKVKNASGEIKKDEDGNEITYHTDNGIFQIGVGETAWFKDIGVNTRYEVKETGYTMPTVNGKTVEGSFQQVTPEGGVSAPGVMTARGKEEIFVNHYIPEDDGETVTFKVRKSCPFLSGYEAPETPEFRFTIKIREKAYSNEEFTIVDANGAIKGTDTTDENGAFTLKGGYTAEFAEVDAGAYYEVKEVESEMPPGWWAIGATSKDGTTSAEPVNFTNSNASFAVSKQMKDGTKPDVDFTFLLTKEDHSVWGGAQYYLYDTATKKLVEPPNTEETTGSDTSGDPTDPDTPGDPVVQVQDDPEGQTDPDVSGDPTNPDNTETSKEEFKNPTTTKSDGTFTLKPGQIAVFTGIAPETTYSVKEVRNPEWDDDTVDYRQVTPEDIDGYTETVGDSILLLPFENEVIINTNTLTVSKRVENLKGDAPEDPDKTFFRFRLSKVTTTTNTNGNVTKSGDPVSNMEYELLEGGETKPGTTDAKGEFTLRADAIARFKTLQLFAPNSGVKYQVEEIVKDKDNKDILPAGYQIDETERVQSAELIRDGDNVSFTFTNRYLADRLDLNLTKTIRKSENVYLKDVAFTLWKVNSTGSSVSSGDAGSGLTWENTAGNRTEIGKYTTDEDGQLQILGVESGVYFLEETRTQEGYRLPKEPIKIVISRKPEDRSQVKVTVNGKSVSSYEEEMSEGSENDSTKYEATSGDIAAQTENLVKRLVLNQSDSNRDEVEFELINDVVYQLPESGGIGIYLYVAAGTLLMMAAAFLYWKRYRLRSA